MANSQYATNGLAGAALLNTTTAPTHALGQRQEGKLNSEWIYCYANTAITGPGYACKIDDTWSADMVTTANNGGRGTKIGFPAVAVPAGSYFWAQVTGPLNAMLAAGTAARSQLNTTVTAGVLGSDATVGSQKVNGLTPKGAQAALGLGACLGSGGFLTDIAN